MQFKTAQGVDIPEIGIGTYRLYGRECKQSVSDALAIGYRHVDTAQMYKNEKEVGDAIYSSPVDREDIFLTTKVWHTNLDHDDVLQSVEDSLRQLRTPYVDLLLIHWPNKQVSIQQTFEAMLTLRDQGKALNVGISNFPLGLTQEIVEELRIPILTNQVEYHPFLAQFDLIDYSYDHDFLVTAYSPLAQGKVLNNDKLIEIAEEYGKTPAQVSLRWLIEQENVVAIPKASSKEHLEDNIDIYDFELSDEHFEQIDALDKTTRLVNPSFAPKWDM
ncbi:aldo/keto reductase [Rhodohalobacter sp. 614A]|uniref:aldo/keto reductase n=1 Tax=Rhodohalobacter sp. 614A TaxID=2908649 RepID=UPI001F37CE92|nr:aldo/keto reductase [Rhodohalobacter sp. 614A]